MHVNEIRAPLPPPLKSPPPAAERLEQAFLEEMLKYCGPKPEGGAFGGGIGEDQFGSFLTREYAAVMAAQIDLGFGKGVESQ